MSVLLVKIYIQLAMKLASLSLRLEFFFKCLLKLGSVKNDNCLFEDKQGFAPSSGFSMEWWKESGVRKKVIRASCLWQGEG